MKRVQSGFTLVELIVVLVIVGILSATALPKFAHFGSEARLAKIDGLASALTSTANLVYAKCMITPACDLTSGSQAINMDGVGYQLNYGYPDAGNAINNSQIDTMLNVSGYDLALLDHTRTIFKVPGAPDPDQCAVVYRDAYEGTSNKQFAVTKLTSGC